MSAGSWTLTKAVFALLTSKGVEANIKRRWKNTNDRERFRAVWKNRVRPGCPFPRVVYSIPSDTRVSGSSGADDNGQNEVDYRSALIQFRCYSTVEQGEGLAVATAEIVVAAFESIKLDFSSSTANHIVTIRQGDIEGRDDEDNYFVGPQYQVDYEYHRPIL